jgi:hypothetical protein
VGGRHLTTGFLGGLFSLDGIHPTNTGYAILANDVISTMNSQMGTIIPLVSVATVAAADPLVFENVAPGAVSTNFNGTPVNGGSYVWFNANFAASGIPAAGAMISLTGSTITFTADHPYELPVPNALITFSANITCASTSFDPITNTWLTTVPISGSDEIFLSGLAFPVPASFASAGGKVKGPVTWNGTVAPEHTAHQLIGNSEQRFIQRSVVITTLSPSNLPTTTHAATATRTTLERRKELTRLA